MDYRNVLIEAFEAGVPLIVKVQQALIDGKETVELNGELHSIVQNKSDPNDKSALSVADGTSQKIFVQTLVDRLSAQGKKVAAVAEEEGLDNIRGLVADADANVRVIVDPIDGTGNYLKKRRSNTQETEGGMGWGSMIAIQEKTDGQWKTVAAGIYESSEKDTPEKLTGRVYISEAGKPDITIGALDTPATARHNLQNNPLVNTHVIGGFIQKAACEPLDEHMKGVLCSQEKNLSCVAQSALSVIVGTSQAYYQEHPNLHDVAAIAHLAEKAGAFAAVMPVLKPGKDGMPTDKIKDGKERYPIIIARDPEVGMTLVKKYLAEKAKANPEKYDEKTVKVMRGDMTEVSLEELARPQGLDTTGAQVNTLREAPTIAKKA